MSIGALEGERQMTSMVPPLHATRDPTQWIASPGWTGTATSDIIFFESYFDCSGYTKDGLTVFPITAALQDAGRYISSNGAVPLQVLDIICQTQLDRTEVYTNLIEGSVPGMLGTSEDYTQIIWGQYRTMLPQASFAGFGTEMLVANASAFGSGSPSTAEKLWIYRFVLLPGSQAGDTLAMPASRFILSSLIGEESELAFLMRQKRSYELTS